MSKLIADKMQNIFSLIAETALLAGTVEYTDCISAKE